MPNCGKARKEVSSDRTQKHQPIGAGIIVNASSAEEEALLGCQKYNKAGWDLETSLVGPCRRVD